MSSPGETFAKICEYRQLSADALTDINVATLACLALDNADYAVPVLAAFKHLAVPIAAEWILSDVNEARKSTVFCRLALLCPLWPPLQPLTEHFLAMNQENGYVSTFFDSEELDDVLIGLIRLLSHDYGRFAGYFSAEMLRQLASQNSKQTRILALQAFGLLTQVSEAVIDDWIIEYVQCDSTEFEFETILRDAQRKAADVDLMETTTLLPASLDYENVLVANVENVFVPRFGYTASKPVSLVRTETAVENLRRMATTLLKDKPLLLTGEPGAGKTFFTEVLHSKVRPNSEIVRIHLGDQTDAKALVGTYTTGAVLGTFEWSPGALTTAVKSGKWVLVEDIDRAPTDIIAVLLPLIDRRELVVPSRNQIIKASPGFQLVATTTNPHIDVIGGRGWARSEILSPTDTDLSDIISAKSPFLARNIINMLLDTFRQIQDFEESHSLVRRATTRDLFKLVARITARYDSDDIFRETVACFASFLTDSTQLATVVADSMGFPASRVDIILSRHKPTISLTQNELVIGRAVVERRPVSSSASRNADLQLQDSKFALTGPTLRLLEEVAVSTAHEEPVLLVGETGTGKTSLVQYLAQLARRKLIVINVSQQVEAGDLIGGFKPIDARQLASSLLDEFYELFDSTFSRAKNHEFLNVLERTVSRQRWSNVVKLLKEAIKMATPQRKGGEAKRPKLSGDWAQFAAEVDAFDKRVKEVQQQAQFQFIEGLLLRAMRQGQWVLLDEFNLAPADTLEGISELMSSRSLTLLEKGGEVVNASSAFRLFANMNPATDVGKRDLPPGVRAQFTEMWVPSPDSDSDALRAIVANYLPQGTQLSVINDVCELYTDAKSLAESHQLVDGAGQRPHFSVRTLSRALVCAVVISSRFGLRRALFEAFSMCFLTLLDDQSSLKLSKAIDARLLAKLPNRNSVLSQNPPEPQDGRRYTQFKHWWMPTGSGALNEDAGYIVTPFVERNLLNLVRATATKLFPVLIQGPTSSGKTSMITHLATRTGHTVVRINNHEHTDLAEYLGGYESDSQGKLVFREGALVTALRQGHWLVLDELNLAPTDVLEALNRLLDDNRELLIPETQEIIRPHPDFILFATQNPPGLYAGRKVLSRAFRNRFLELHFGDIPESELEIILRDRSRIAPSYASKIVEVYRELGRRRSSSRVFEHPATLRDLFRWANRPAVGYEELAQNGFALLGERARSADEREVVRSVISDVMRVPVDIDYAQWAPEEVMNAAPSNIVWTVAMRRVLALVHLALLQNEPVLLVGETGCGKTTIVQALAAARKQRLTILNAHQNTETGDLVGSQRPARHGSSTKLFEWVDGPLVTALKNGDFFLLDEISLADDSVLERLNSVLEADRTLFVPEIGSFHAEEGFQFLATMNPGGDYGKKELSPALRNRFTEIWVPSVDSEDDLKMIVRSRLQSVQEGPREKAVDTIVVFSQYFADHFGMVSLRDVLSWTEFVGTLGVSESSLVQGASMVFIDGLGSNAYAHLASQPNVLARAKSQCFSELENLVGTSVDVMNADLNLTETEITIGGFSLPRMIGSQMPEFSFSAPTAALNAMRVVRALQSKKPVLLEGSPGAGKTSLITALAKASGHRLTRINLSDQTDLADLFGSDIPLDKPGQFGWRDAPFLRAMQKGEWVLLDEMNLAPQQVLEGLNACLDHRGEAYVPELDQTFSKHPDFVVFAAQNPHAQGGGRKGLPKSFVNRFAVVYVEQLGLDDLHAIAASCYPAVDHTIREPLATFVEELAHWTATRQVAGGPFEFNLRDTMRWLDLVAQTGEHPSRFLGLVVTQRFRTPQDRKAVEAMFGRYFKNEISNNLNPVSITPNSISFGAAKSERSSRTFARTHFGILSGQIEVLETATYCIQQRWPLILIGSSGSGKTSVVRLLAQLCGARLQEFAMTADVDSTDLLGEFDQVEEQSQLERLWSDFEELVDIPNISTAALIDAIRSRDLDTAVSLLPKDHPLLNMVQDFRSRDYTKPTFQWFDGMLVRAVERGHWLVLDNANLCSPAVLDRLNSLLERDGTLLVNECAENDGSPREVIPHPNFRLFLTVDPRYGELSRAMRNRGTEVWMSPDMRDGYDMAIAKKQVTAGALSVLQFSKPFNAAKFADLRHKTWLRALLLDPITALHIGVVDPELHDFSSQFKQDGYAETAVAVKLESLQRLWSVFTTRKILSKAEMTDTPSNLLELSALRRRKDSIDCDFDLYGVAVQICDFVVKEPFGELASVLIDFLSVEDPSRVPVFRDWFIKFGKQHKLSHFVEAVLERLGTAYDFSSGGIGMDRLWQAYSRQLGFPTLTAHEAFVHGQRIAAEFDQLVKPLGLEHTEAISGIRSALIEAMGSELDALHELEIALKTFKDSLPTLDVEHMPNKLLVDQFKGLFASFALAFAEKPSSQLRTALARLATYAEVSTVDVFELTAEKALHAPAISELPRIESIIITALQLDVQGVARDELAELSCVILEHSSTIRSIFKPEEMIGKLVTSNARLIAIAVPEAADTMTEICELTMVDAMEACARLASTLLELYVCPLPLDPAIAQHVWYERYIRLQSVYSNDQVAWDEIREVFGCRESDVDGWLQSRELAHVPVPTVYRPEKSAAAQVYRDMVAASQLAKSSLRTLTNEESQVIKRNAAHLQERLGRASDYRDLVEPVRAALAMVTLSLSVPKQTKDVGNLWLLDPTTLGNSIPGSISDYPLLVLRSLACSDNLLLGPLREVLDDLYRRWTLERLRVEEERREEAAGFRYDDDDGLAAEREFMAMFPDYEQETELPRKADDFAPRLVSIYKSLFSGLKADAVKVSIEAASEIQGAEGMSSDRHIPALYLAIRDHLTYQVDQNTEINFYIDSSASESATSVQFATKVGDRVRNMLQMWPEHDALQTLLSVSDEIRNLPPAVPIALHLAKTEQLHHWLYEWNRFASKEAQVADLISNGSSIIVCWRRLELATWPALFAVERKKCVEENARFWYNLYETLIVSPAEDVTDTTKVLTVFMSEATIGQFEDRLELLRCFQKHNAMMGSEEMAQCIGNVAAFYQQFLPAVKQRLLSTEKELKKQVHDVVKLASWRDVNVHALKQSAQRSHRQLFKIVKKYRALLAEKAPSELMSSPHTPVVKLKVGDWLKRWNPQWIFPLQQPLENIPQWKDRPRPLQDVETTAKVLQTYVKQLANAETANLMELADNIAKHAEELKAETPKTLSKDTKKIVANLRLQKQQVLTATLRELRRAGLHTSVRKDVAASQMELTRVLAKTPNLSGRGSELEASESNFFAFIELLPRLRAAVSDAANNPQIDVPFADLQRGLAFTENIFAHILRLRRVAAKHLAATGSRELGNPLLELAETKTSAIWNYESVSQTSNKVSELVNITSTLVERLYGEVGVKEPNELVKLRTSNVHKPVSSLEQRSKAASEWLQELTASVEALEFHCKEQDCDSGAGQLVYPVVEKLNNTLADCVSSLKPIESPSSVSQVDEAVTLASNTILVIVQQVVKELRSKEGSKTAVGDDKLDKESDEDDDDQWLTLSLVHAERLLLSLRPSQVAPKLLAATNLILGLSASNVQLASAFAALLVAFVQGYYDLVDAVEAVYARTLTNTVSGASKLASMLLSLALEGFCSPEATNDEDDTEEGAQGTGLGDGTGAQSSSKDVEEEDDDVSEAMQTANPEQQERDEADEGEDNAREVEGDMAGMTEDLPPQSDEEDDEKDDNDEEQPDDEVGDLEDLDPNAVDEKMWDDQKEETDEKEKHTEENVQGSKDEDFEARDNDEDKEKESSNNAADDNPAEDEDGSDADEAEEQDDDVKQGDQDELQESTEQKDALDLPEDMDLDDDGKDSDEQGEEASDPDEDIDTEFKDPMDNVEEDNVESERSQGEMDIDKDDEDSAEPDDHGEEDQAQSANEEDAEKQEDDADIPESGSANEADDIHDEPDEMELDEEQQQALPEGDGNNADVEGLDGPNDEQSERQQEQSAATDDHTDNKGQGASEDAANEEAHLGTGGSSGANAEDTQDQPEDSSRNDVTSESLKTLGDAMKEFHRRHRPIRERGEEEQEESEGANDPDKPLQGQDELEHVGADDVHDTQALGRSNEQDRQSIDDELAIDDEQEPDTTKDVAGDADENADKGGQAGGDAEALNTDEEEQSEEENPSIVNAGMNNLPDDESEDEVSDHRNVKNEEDAPTGSNTATDLWQTYEAKTHELALVLGEQLRLILEPTVASKLRGDFRTGKRLNMKRIIPYIASEFRKDKIWLRRTKPAKRQYQVLLALDDSRSMGEPAVVDLAFRAIALVGTALSNIEAGQMGIAKFGDTTEFVHNLDQPFTPQAGNAVLKQFGFAQERTNVCELLERSLEMFSDHQSSGEQWRLEIIVSDGITDDHDRLRRLVRRARDARVMPVFVILDALNRDTSILNMNEVRYITDEHGNQKLEVTKYMEDFPFEYYVLVRNIADLPMVLASVLRQYFQAVDE